MKLSPLNFSSLLAQQQLASEVAAPQGSQASRREAIAITVYECPDCGERHDWEDDALECCAHAVLGSPRDDEGDTPCPICGEQAGDYYEAADCCLWKDYGAPERWRMASAMEAGSTWREQLGLDA